MNTYKRLSIYTTTACNGKCGYCYQNGLSPDEIKHPQDYNIYINKLLQLDVNNRATINSIELWGGEPTLFFNEFLIYWETFNIYFPNLNEIQFSTNLLNGSVENIINMAETIDNDINHNLTLRFQISIDGDSKINDFNKQYNCCEEITNNLLELLDYIDNNNLNFVNFDISTHSVLTKETLQLFNSYQDIDNWFNFFINTFNNENIKFRLFKVEYLSHPQIWELKDAEHFSDIISWVDIWKNENKEKAKRIIWPDYKINELKICAAGQPQGTISLSPSGEIMLCHRNLFSAIKFPILKPIDLTEVYSLLENRYSLYKDYISKEDFLASLNIFISMIWCPVLYAGEFDFPQNWIYQPMDIYYRGAMNTILKWSKENE